MVFGSFVFGTNHNVNQNQARPKPEYSESGLGDAGGFVVTIPSFSDFTVQAHKSDESIQSRKAAESREPKDGRKKEGRGKEGHGTMASITQGIDTMPDSGFIHKYLFEGAWYKRFRSLFLVSDRPTIHRLGYRSPVSVFVERSRHLSSFPNMIHPYSAFRWYWDILMTLFLFFTLLVDPVRMTFYAQELVAGSPGHVQLSLVITVVYMTDILLNFRTGVVDERNDLVNLDPSLVGMAYVRSWFLIDFLSTVPFDLIYMLVEGWGTGSEMDFAQAVRILELLKVFRLVRAIRYISRLLFAYKIPRMYIHFIELNTAATFLLHWLACFHYLIPDLVQEGLVPKNPRSWLTQLDLWNSSVPEKYVNAYYRALCLGSGLGSGSSLPRQPEEILVSVLNILVGVTCLSCFIGQVAALLSARGVPERKYVETVNQVKEYLRFKQVPLELQNRILLFYENRYQRNYFREQEILNSVSDVLRRDLLMHNCRHLVRAVPIFADLPPTVLYALISHLVFQVYLPLDVVVTVGDVGDSMYFIEHGMVSILEENGRVLGHLKDGDFFGELALITTERRVATVVATSSVNAYSLSREEFNRAMENYPEILQRIVKIANERTKKGLGGGGGLVDGGLRRTAEEDILLELRRPKSKQSQASSTTSGSGSSVSVSTVSTIPSRRN